jgi:hypothetical protein
MIYYLAVGANYDSLSLNWQAGEVVAHNPKIRGSSLSHNKNTT